MEWIRADVSVPMVKHPTKPAQTSAVEMVRSLTGGKFAGVFSLFEQAINSKLKYPAIRLQTPDGQAVCLKRAGDKSKYTGQIMVTDGGPYGANVYFGRIDQTGTFHVSTNNRAVSD